MSSSTARPWIPELIGRVRSEIRRRNYSLRTEEAYVAWIERFLATFDQHPKSLGSEAVKEFLSHLAIAGKVSPSTQNQALSALLFLFVDVLGLPFGYFSGIARAKRPKRLPVVLSRQEIQLLLAYLSGTPHTVCALLYGSGVRLLEALTLRVKDLDFGREEITVRQGKGQKDRVTILPRSLAETLKKHLASRKELHQSDLSRGLGRVPLDHDHAARHPAHQQDWAWQWVFPATGHYLERSSGNHYRHHIHETSVQKAFRLARIQSGIIKPATPHTLRHSFATHLLEDGYTIVRIQKYLGHSDVSTTMIYTHVAEDVDKKVVSPLDRILGRPSPG